MFGQFIEFAKNKWVAPLNIQNTGRAVYERPFTVANVSLNGAGGVANFRNIGALSPALANAPQKVVPASITGIGNSTSYNPELDPLNNQQDNFTIGSGPQF